MKNSAALLLVVLTALCFQDVFSTSCHCGIAYEPVGCYKDKENDRALPDYIMTERDSSIKIFNGHKIDWGHYNTYLPQFVCRCAEVAHNKGHSYFAVQYFGECWSGSDAAETYNKHGEEKATLYEEDGEKKGCIGPDFKVCPSNKKKHCVGREHTNYVYKIKGECADSVMRVGCFKDKDTPNRALPDYYQNDRDKSIDNYSGISIQWSWYDSYLQKSLLCRCADLAKERGYKVFGLQYYGECWGSENGLETYFKYSERSNCIDTCYQKCEPSSRVCMGKHYTNFVYRFAISDETPCAVPHAPVGCFEESASNKIMSQLLLTDSDASSNVFTGYTHLSLPSLSLKERFPELACSCAFKAKEKGFQYFGLKSTGDCYGGNDSGESRPVSSECYSDFGDTVPCAEGETTGCGGGETHCGS